MACLLPLTVGKKSLKKMVWVLKQVQAMYIFVNIIDKEGKNNLYKYSKAELTGYIEKTKKNLELFRKEPLAFMKIEAQKVAIDSYVINNKLTF